MKLADRRRACIGNGLAIRTAAGLRIRLEHVLSGSRQRIQHFLLDGSGHLVVAHVVSQCLHLRLDVRFRQVFGILAVNPRGNLVHEVLHDVPGAGEDIGEVAAPRAAFLGFIRCVRVPNRLGLLKEVGNRQRRVSLVCLARVTIRGELQRREQPLALRL